MLRLIVGSGRVTFTLLPTLPLLLGVGVERLFPRIPVFQSEFFFKNGSGETSPAVSTISCFSSRIVKNWLFRL